MTSQYSHEGLVAGPVSVGDAQLSSEVQQLIDTLPVSVWVEDFSQVQAIRDGLVHEGISSFRERLEVDPELVLMCLDEIIVLGLNVETLRLFEAPTCETLLHGLRSCFTPSSMDAFREELIDLFEDRVPRDLEADFLTLAGNPRSVLISLSLAPEHAHWSRVFITLTDITEQKRVERELRLTEGFLRETERVGRIGGWAVDAATRDMRWSDEIFRIFGYDPSERPDIQQALEHYPEDAQATLSQAIERCFEDGSSYELDLPFLDADGRKRWTRSIGHADCEAGVVIGINGTLQDITSLRQAEERRRKLEAETLHSQKLKSLGVLAGGIAHDFNNILSVVIGHAELGLASCPVSCTNREGLLHIRAAAERAARLAGQMLSYAGRGRFVLVPVDLARFVPELASLLRLAISKKTQLDLNLAPDLPIISIDREQFEQVLLNLVMNGSEALEKTEGHVHVRIGLITLTDQQLVALESELPLGHHSPPPGGEFLLVEVQDDGSGIQPEDLPHVFDPFFTTKFTGRGLGMASVAGILRSQKGAAAIESSPGAGTSVQVFLPLVRTNEVPVKRMLSVPQPTSAELPPGGSGHILVAEDEASVREVLHTMLVRLGFHVTLACNGLEALELFEQSATGFDLALFDVTMPHLDGVELYDRIHAQAPALPIILSSGYAAAGLAARLEGRTPAAFLPKPFSFEELQITVLAASGSLQEP